MQNSTAVNSHTQLCIGYFELLCSYVEEGRLFPLYKYKYLTPDISKSCLPQSKLFSKEGPNIIFSTDFYEKVWDSVLCSTSNELKMLSKTKSCRKAKMRHQMKIHSEIYWRKSFLPLLVFLCIWPVSASQMANLGVRNFLSKVSEIKRKISRMELIWNAPVRPASPFSVLSF